MGVRSRLHFNRTEVNHLVVQGLGILDELVANWCVAVWYRNNRRNMSNRNKPDATEEWLLNEATQEEIEVIANG